MSDIAIRVENLGKMYRIGGPQESYSTFRDAITRIVTSPFRRARDLLGGQAYGAAGLQEEIWALKDISFEVKHGEVVGIIGRNGAGKSTLLKVLSRITEPTTGYADIYGRVGALLEVGTGFHPELTGRENIYLNGAILGMSRAEIDRKFDEIVDFAGVERFIDTPVKHYSSGMGLRLGFAVAAHLEPDILIVDEVLAVGDVEFQKKCLGKMSDVASEGRTVLFVSHNMAAVENLCTRGIVLSKGTKTYSGTQNGAISYYLSSIRTTNHSWSFKDQYNRKGSGVARIVGLEIKNLDGQVNEAVSSGQDFDIYLYFEVNKSEANTARVGLHVYSQNETLIFSQMTRIVGIEFRDIPDSGAFVCRIFRLPLPASSYRIACTLKIGEEIADTVENAATLTVVEGDFFKSGHVLPVASGICLVDGAWRMIDGEEF